MKINRRDFIKTGGMVMLGSLAAPSFLGSCTGNGTDQATGISFAQNHFGVSESDMKKVLTAALRFWFREMARMRQARWMETMR